MFRKPLDGFVNGIVQFRVACSENPTHRQGGRVNKFRFNAYKKSNLHKRKSTLKKTSTVYKDHNIN